MIFISYNSNDKQVIEPVAITLERYLSYNVSPDRSRATFIRAIK